MNAADRDSDQQVAVLVRRIAAALVAKSARIAVAESCTGGWITKALSDLPGCSGWFGYGFVAYSDEAKQDLLGVSAETIAVHGAVSQDVAEQMATGARLESAAEIAVAVTGIAGPGGGSSRKPVGTIHWAVAYPGGDAALMKHLAGDRDKIRAHAACIALDLVRRTLLRIHPGLRRA